MQVGNSATFSKVEEFAPVNKKPSAFSRRLIKIGFGKREREDYLVRQDGSYSDGSSEGGESEGASVGRSEASGCSDAGAPPARQPFRYAQDRALSDFTVAAGEDYLHETPDLYSDEELDTGMLLDAVAILSEADIQPTPLHRHKENDGLEEANKNFVSDTRSPELPKAEARAKANENENTFLLLPQETTLADRHTLVLDLDETLVHSSCSSEEWYPEQGDFECDVEDEGESIHIYVRLRPGVREFLEKMSKLYEVVLFTAGTEKYARQVLRKLDPYNEWFHHVLSRQHCSYYILSHTGAVTLGTPPAAGGSKAFHNIGTIEQGEYVKDLSRLGREIDRIVIIDNNPKCFMLHPRNAIECATWRFDREDNELTHFGTFLENVYIAPDVFFDLDNFHKTVEEELARAQWDLN